MYWYVKPLLLQLRAKNDVIQQTGHHVVNKHALVEIHLPAAW